MRNVLRKVLSLLLAATILLSIGGCASGTQSTTTQAAVQNTTAATTAKPAEKITLSMWESDPLWEDQARARVANIEEHFENIKIELEIKTTDQYPSLLNTAIQAGACPDIFYTNGTKDAVAKSANSMGALMDLTPYIDLTGFDPALTGVLWIDGKLLTSPGAYMATRAVYYNKRLFRENGWEVPKTLSEFEALCDQIIAETGMVPVQTSMMDGWLCVFTMDLVLAAVSPDFMQEYENGTATLSDPRLLAAFKKFEEWAAKGYFGDNYKSIDRPGFVMNFAKENTPMCFSGSWNMSVFPQSNDQLELGAFHIPGPTGKTALIITPSCGYSIYTKTKYPEECISVLQHLNSTESLQMFLDITGELPARQGLTPSSELGVQVGQADVMLQSIMELIGWWPKEGEEPRLAWNEDAVKWIGGQLTIEEFLGQLDSMQDYSLR